MTTNEPNYWPFPIPLPREQWSEEQSRVVEFLDASLQEGFQPRLHLVGGGEYQVQDGTGREAWLISRGRVRTRYSGRWEIRLLDRQASSAHYWVERFGSAADTVMQWLRGEPLEVLLASAKPSMIRGPRIIPQPALSPA